MSELLGKNVLGYHVDSKVGSGSFGTVYRVSKTNASGTNIRALKHITIPAEKDYSRILNSYGGDYSKTDRHFNNIFENTLEEIRIIRGLSENGANNIVHHYDDDVIEYDSPKKYEIFILMELLTPLPQYYETNGFTVADVIRLGKDVLSALISCHRNNIIHRDIKDDNIFVSPDNSFCRRKCLFAIP